MDQFSALEAWLYVVLPLPQLGRYAKNELATLFAAPLRLGLVIGLLRFEAAAFAG